MACPKSTASQTPPQPLIPRQNSQSSEPQHFAKPAQTHCKTIPFGTPYVTFYAAKRMLSSCKTYGFAARHHASRTPQHTFRFPRHLISACKAPCFPRQTTARRHCASPPLERTAECFYSANQGVSLPQGHHSNASQDGQPFRKRPLLLLKKGKETLKRERRPSKTEERRPNTEA